MNFSRLLFLPVQFEQHHHFQVLLSQLGEVLGLKGTSKSSSASVPCYFLVNHCLHIESFFHKSCLLDLIEDPRAVAIHGEGLQF